MDVEFIYNTQTRSHTIEIEGEHACIAAFLNSEFKVSKGDTSEIETFLSQLEKSEVTRFKFIEWTVDVDADEIQVIHNSEFLDGVDALDSEGVNEFVRLSTSCGKVDMMALLVNWADFVANER